MRMIDRALYLILLAGLLTRTIGGHGNANNTLSARQLMGTAFRPATASIQKLLPSHNFQTDGQKLPSNFDPQAYLEYNPDVALGVTGLSRHEKHQHAWRHYEEYGWKEKRVYSRVPVIFG
jgi:hypothetical protein